MSLVSVIIKKIIAKSFRSSGKERIQPLSQVYIRDAENTIHSFFVISVLQFNRRGLWEGMINASHYKSWASDNTRTAVTDANFSYNF